MTIYKYKKNGLMYLLYIVTPPKILGRYLKAEPYLHNTEISKDINLEDFVEVGTR
jgi:hypothetical protein